jgi:class 3 adenylate cyclase
MGSIAREARTPRTIEATPAVRWLLRDASALATPGAMLGGLFERIVGENLRLASSTLTVTSLDPMISSTRVRWERDPPRVLEEILLHGMQLEASSGVEGLRFVIPGTSYEVEWQTPDAEFSAQESAFFEAVSALMAAPLQAVIGRAVTRSLLQAYLGRRSADRVLRGAVRRGTGEIIDAVIWMSDLRNFTALSDALAYQQVIAALNDCCARIVGAIQPLGGEVLKFIGDGLLAIFPLKERGEVAACDAAIAAVRAAREGMTQLDAERIGRGLPALPFGVGLHLGSIVYGNIGSPDRLDFTAIGSAVNVASRIEGMCKPLGYPVLMSADVAIRTTNPLHALGDHSLRGTSKPVALFTLPELRSNAQE